LPINKGYTQFQSLQQGSCLLKKYYAMLDMIIAKLYTYRVIKHFEDLTGNLKSILLTY